MCHMFGPIDTKFCNEVFLGGRYFVPISVFLFEFFFSIFKSILDFEKVHL